ncbi:hypothetical protein BDZ97DRAFT_1225751 [Flammula alnicola]|nr:hypothetical protein BDZ97DRAFT_1225751 [Flammula alnicola]
MKENREFVVLLSPSCHSTKMPTQPSNMKIELWYGIQDGGGSGLYGQNPFPGNPHPTRNGRSATIILGARMTAADEHALIADLENKVTIIPDIEVVSVIAHYKAWTKKRSKVLEHRLPSSVKEYNKRVIDPGHNREALTTKFFNYVIPIFVSYIALAIDEIDEDTAQATSKLPSLQHLIVRPPNHPASFQQNAPIFLDALLRMLACFCTLRTVSIYISYLQETEYILLALQNHPALTKLELVATPFLNLIGLPGSRKIQFQNTIIRGLENLGQIQELSIPVNLMNPLLVEMLGRMAGLRVLRVRSTSMDSMSGSIFLSNLAFDASGRSAFRTLEVLDVGAAGTMAFHSLANRFPNTTIL